jgi:hypothetical protein
MAPALRQFIQEEYAVVGQRHVARHRHVALTDQPDIRDGVMRRVKRAGCDQRRVVAGLTGDTGDTRGLHCLGAGHRRQNGGEMVRQPRPDCPGGRTGAGYGQNACRAYSFAPNAPEVTTIARRVGLCAGSWTPGYAINPARDVGGRAQRSSEPSGTVCVYNQAISSRPRRFSTGHNANVACRLPSTMELV